MFCFSLLCLCMTFSHFLHKGWQLLLVGDAAFLCTSMCIISFSLLLLLLLLLFLPSTERMERIFFFNDFMALSVKFTFNWKVWRAKQGSKGWIHYKLIWLMSAFDIQRPFERAVRGENGVFINGKNPTSLKVCICFSFSISLPIFCSISGCLLADFSSWTIL